MRNQKRREIRATLQFMVLVSAIAITIAACSNGKDGKPGKAGAPGRDGVGCTVVEVEGGALIECGGNTSAVILDGEDGEDGQDAPEPAEVISVIEIINPCGPQGTHDEVLLRLSTGELLAHYSSGGKEFLSLIGPGSYRTTDGTHCNFNVNSLLQVSW